MSQFAGFAEFLPDFDDLAARVASRASANTASSRATLASSSAFMRADIQHIVTHDDITHDDITHDDITHDDNIPTTKNESALVLLPLSHRISEPFAPGDGRNLNVWDNDASNQQGRQQGLQAILEGITDLGLQSGSLLCCGFLGRHTLPLRILKRLQKKTLGCCTKEPFNSVSSFNRTLTDILRRWLPHKYVHEHRSGIPDAYTTLEPS
jgi:hypothetical protein